MSYLYKEEGSSTKIFLKKADAIKLLFNQVSETLEQGKEGCWSVSEIPVENTEEAAEKQLLAA